MGRFNRNNFWGKGFYYLFLTCLFSSIFTKSVHGATGINHTINFQGKLVNSDGTNVSNGSYSIVFSLYTVSSGGSAAWTETDSVTTTDGVFRVALGAGTTFSSAGIDFNSDTYYLGIKVGSDAEMTPRVQFTTVPYAFNAEKVNGLVVTNTTGTLTIPNSTTISFGGAFTTAGSSGLTLTTTGTTNATLPSGTITLVDLVSSQTVTNKIIGSTGLTFSGATTDITTGANEDFDIAPNGTGKIGLFTTGTLRASLDIRSNGGTLAVASVSGATSFAGLVIDNSGKGDILTASSSGLNRFVITQNGSVGIGTTTPLDDGNGAGGSNGIGMLQVKNTTSGMFPKIIVDGPIDGGSGLELYAGGVSKGSLDFAANINQLELAARAASAPITFKTFNTSLNEVMRITANQTVGIGGVTTPLATLDLQATSGTLPIASISGKTSFAGLVVDNSGKGDIITASSSGMTRFRITNNGSVLFQGDTISSSTSASLSNNGSGAVVNALGDQGSLVPNAGFEANTSNSLFADSWVASATNSAAVTRDTTTIAKGTSSVQIKVTNSSEAIYSACIPLALASGVGTSGTYSLNWYEKATTVIPTVRGYIDGYTSKANCQSNTSPTISTAIGGAIANTTQWSVPTGNVSALAANITWGRVHFFVGSNGTNAQVNIDGVRLIESVETGGLDYAENYPADPRNIPQPGEVVSLDVINGSTVVKPADKSMDQSVIGVVSTNPGQILDDGSIADPKVPIALSGRIPTKVSTKNGVIHIGDYLASSDIPGVAVKAISAGTVIGIAMEDDSDVTHIKPIILFVKNTYYPGYPSLDATAILSANKTTTNQVAGLDVITNQLAQLSSRVASLSANIGVLGVSTSETKVTPSLTLNASTTDAGTITFDGLTVINEATISGKLRVKGSGLFEGVLSVIDTLKANDFMTTGIAEFFNMVMFHNDVSFEGRPTFNNDTAGSALIKKGSNHVDITFDTVYDTIPIINATLTLTTISMTPTPGDDKTPEQQFLDKGYSYIVSKRSTKGFTIVLNKYADEDISFSWSVFSIKDPKTFQSGGEFLPTPSIMISPDASDAAN